MALIKKLLAAAIAVTIVGGFMYLGYWSMESAHQAGLQKHSASTVPPQITSQSANEAPAVGNDTVLVSNESEPQKSLDIEGVRRNCIEEMKSTARITLGTESSCAQYAKMLDGQFARVKPSQPYRPVTERVAQVQAIASPANDSPEQNQMPSHAELVKRCGNRFDDINGGNLKELKRRYKNRQESLVPSDSEEMRELRCRITLVSAAQ